MKVIYKQEYFPFKVDNNFALTPTLVFCVIRKPITMTHADNIEQEPTYSYQKHVKASKKAVKIYLLTQGYTYNPAKKRWKCGKKKIDHETMLVGVIIWSRANSPFKEHGLFAQETLKDLIKDPDFTARSYIESQVIQKRGNRISGKEVFAEYCKLTGIEIIGTVEDFAAKNSHKLKQFYDRLAGCFPYVSISKRARIFGKLFSSVFIGIALRGDTETRSVSPLLSILSNLGIEPPQIQDLTTHYKTPLSASPPI